MLGFGVLGVATVDLLERKLPVWVHCRDNGAVTVNLFEARTSCPDIGTAHPRGLMVMQSVFRLTGTVFYLGNVG